MYSTCIHWFIRRSLEIWVPWYAGMLIAERAVRHWPEFLHGGWLTTVPIGLAFGIVFGGLSAWIMARSELKWRLPGRRVRDAMLADAAAERRRRAPPSPPLEQLSGANLDGVGRPKPRDLPIGDEPRMA